MGRVQSLGLRALQDAEVAAQSHLASQIDHLRRQHSLQLQVLIPCLLHSLVFDAVFPVLKVQISCLSCLVKLKLKLK